MLKRLLLTALVSCITLFGSEFLMPEEAFRPSVSVTKNGDIAAKIDLGNHIYLYKSKLHAKILGNSGITIKHITLPEGSDHEGQTVFMESPNFIELAI
ncbi:MAG: protein-disulfide reductase DsbD family protein [Sulfuricurvum sp.]|nr:protein-disulfide reductase DsbD family protein [Sulfuricurvum sp.]